MAGSAIGLCLVVGTGACDAGNTGQETSPTTSVTVPAPSQDPRGAAEGAALDAYRGMWAAYAEAGLTANPDEPDLSRFAGDGALKTLRNGLAAYRSKKQVLKGKYVLNPEVAEVALTASPATVTVTDCIDDSAFLVYNLSGEPINDVPGGRRSARATVTNLAAGGWKVTSFGVQDVGSC
ncbi:hypothetical protein [Micromonospora sp. WMMD980]|uniref:hypothetical protein n=1 Tax=Micromonospora sp. WMMD980 TaxID=3016088 RepID=UPI002416BB22|nr:hypothetical protein [Micromonospora sp. WMMD980]MDG4803157.1 hypothetical protein [Micromonospora sp. WMMD980]